MSMAARFHQIPRVFGGCVYAAELSNGLVKVGFSRNPRTRMGSLVTQARRIFGAEIVRFHIGVDMRASAQAIRAEREVLVRASRIGSPCKESQEFFGNLPFPVAANLIDQLSRREYA